MSNDKKFSKVLPRLRGRDKTYKKGVYFLVLHFVKRVSISFIHSSHSCVAFYFFNVLSKPTDFHRTSVLSDVFKVKQKINNVVARGGVEPPTFRS